MKRKLAALLGGVAVVMAGLSAAAPALASSHAPHRAGTCTVSGTWFESNQNGSVSVTANTDTCSGGGTIKWQAEERCATTDGGILYTYGGWKSGTDTSIAGDSACTTGGGGEMLNGYIRINENSPERFTLWTEGSTQHGTFNVSS